jgi:cytochrome c553
MATDRSARGRARRQLARYALALGSVAASGPASAAATFEDTIAQRVVACTGCHGKEGRAAPDGYYPRIAGKPAGYLFNQLRNFRDERRHYELMNGLIALLDDAYLQEIADHFASLDLPYPPPLAPAGSAAQRDAGEALVRRGDPARSLPACNDCHGVQMTGLAPFVPGLLGLPRDYLNAQLGAWRSGQRRALPPDCMAQVAQRLSPEDIGAVSAWLAAQPVPAPATAPPAVDAAADRLRRRQPRPARERPGAMKLGKASIALTVVAALVLLAAIAVVWLNRDDDLQRAATRVSTERRRARRARRVPGSCRQLLRLPHRARRRAVRRRARDRDAVRHRQRAQPDRRCHRPGGMEQRRLLARPAQRPLARRAAALSRLSVPELHASRARRCRRDVRVPEELGAGGQAEPAARAAISVRPTGGARGLARALLSSRPSSRPTARSRRSGTAAPTWSRRSAIAMRATRAATSSARRRARSISPAA